MYNRAPLDVAKGFRRPASIGRDQYLQIQNLPILNVGVAAMPLTQRRLPVFMAMLQASNANGGIIYTGGPSVSAGGLEIIGGAAMLFSTSPEMSQQAQSMPSYFPGVTQYQQVMAPSVRGAGGMLLFDLNQIWVMASIAFPVQTLRVLFMCPVR